MGFEKIYPNRKDKRKRYRGSKAFDRTCRNHGSCPWCKSNRQHSNNKEELRYKESLKDFYENRENENKQQTVGM